jgi:hypothetical protein
VELRAVASRVDSHTLHAAERDWPETNCYLDLWIGLLHAIGQDPRPLLGVAAGLAWEGDHFSFLKPCAADIQVLTGAVLQELALWGETEHHVAVQLARGAVPLLEVDAWYLPDTQGTAHRLRHTKTTIAVLAQDRGACSLDYLHNSGAYRLEGEDYAGVLGLAPHGTKLFPFAELVRLPAAMPNPVRQAVHARKVLARLAASRPAGNPVAEFAADLPALMAASADPVRVHALCFNTVRQLGAGFGLLADHLEWLGGNGCAARRLSGQAKTLQFRIARSARKTGWDCAIDLQLAEMATTWEAACAAALAA